MKIVCRLCSYYSKHKQPQQNDFTLLAELSSVYTNLKLSQLSFLEKNVQEFLVEGFEESDRSRKVEKQLEDFGMSKVLQLSPLTLQEAQTLSDLEEECSEV